MDSSLRAPLQQKVTVGAELHNTAIAIPAHSHINSQQYTHSHTIRTDSLPHDTRHSRRKSCRYDPSQERVNSAMSTFVISCTSKGSLTFHSMNKFELSAAVFFSFFSMFSRSDFFKNHIGTNLSYVCIIMRYKNREGLRYKEQTQKWS